MQFFISVFRRLKFHIVLLSIGLSFLGVHFGRSDEANDSHEFADFNFQISGLGENWNKSPNPKAINPRAIAVFRATNRIFLIFAEVLPPGVDLKVDDARRMQIEELKTVSLENVREVAPRNFGKVEFTIVQAEKTVANVGYMTSCAIALHNNVVYRLMLHSEKLSPEELRKCQDAAFGAFALIDRNRYVTYRSPTPVEDIRSTHFGFETNFADSAWGSAPDVAKLIPHAEFVAGIDPHVGAIIVPVDVPPGEHSADDIRIALLRTSGFDDANDNPAFKGTPCNMGEVPGIEVTRIKPQSDGRKIRYLIQTMSAHGRAILIAAWTDESVTNADNLLRDGVSRINIFEKFEAAGAPSNDRYLARQADFTNLLGVLHFQRGDLARAADLFRKAQQLQPAHPTYLNNLLRALTDASRYGEALAVIDSQAISDDKMEHDLLSQRGWLLSLDSRHDEAVAAFDRAFSGDYRNDEYFTIYVNLLLTMQRADDACSHLAAYRSKGDSHQLTSLHCLALTSAGKGEEALAILESKELLGALSQELEFAFVDVLSELERNEEALTRINKVIAKLGETPDSLYRKAMVQVSLGKYEDARSTLEKALTLSPNSETLQTALVHVGGLLGKGDSVHVRNEIKPVPLEEGRLFKITELAELANTPNEHGATYLQRRIAWDMSLDNPIRRTTYMEILIHDRRGIEALSSLQISLDILQERLFVNQLQVLDDKGAVVYEGKVDDYHVSDDASDMGTYDKVVTLPISGLVPNGRLICVVTTEDLHASQHIPFDQCAFFSTFPTLDASLTVHSAFDRIKTHLIGDIRETRTSGTISFHASQVPGYMWEPDQPELMTFLPNVTLSDARATWKEIGDEYLAMIEHRLNHQDDVRELAKQLTAHCRSDAEKIEVLSTYVQKSVTYQAMEFGRRSHVMELPKTVLSNKYGDCKDHSLLLHDLLSSVGISSRLAVVNTASDIYRDLPALDQFDHMIVCVFANKKAFFIDCTDKYALASGSLWSLAGRQALVLVQGKSRLVDITVPASSTPDVTSKRTVEVKPGVTQVREQLEFRDRTASGFRALLASAQAGTPKSLLQSLMAQIEPKVQVQDVRLSGLEEIQQPLSIEIDYLLPTRSGAGPAKLEGQHPLLWEKYLLGIEYVDQRTSPFAWRLPLRYHGETRLLDSSQFKVGGDFGVQTGKTDFMIWRVKTERTSDSALITVDAKRLPGRHAPERYLDCYNESLEFEHAANWRFTMTGLEKN